MRSWVTKNFGWKLLSLALAIILWYTIVGEPELTTSLTVPVQFKNNPKDLEISSEVPDRVHLEVRGPSQKLNPTSLAGSAVILDLSTFQQPGEQTFTIGKTNTSLPMGVAFYRALPAQLRLRFDRQLSREVPVQVRFAGPPPQGYRLVSQRLKPDKLRIIGPEKRVEQVEFVQTDPVDLSAVVSEAEFHVHSSLADPQVRLESPSLVSVRVALEKIRKTETMKDTGIKNKKETP